MHALVVDDDPSIRGMLEFLLSSEGIEVSVAANGAEALDAIRKLQPDVVLLDVMMPRMDGFEVVERIREDPASAETPIVLISARATDHDVWKGWRVGADSYVTKPVDIPVLFTEIRRVTRDRSVAMAS